MDEIRKEGVLPSTTTAPCVSIHCLSLEWSFSLSGTPQSTGWGGRVRTVPLYVLENAVSASQISVKSQMQHSETNSDNYHDLAVH